MVNLHCLRVYPQPNQLPKSTRIIVLYGSCITEDLQDRVTLENHFLHFGCRNVEHLHDLTAAETDSPQCLLIGLGLA